MENTTYINGEDNNNIKSLLLSGKTYLFLQSKYLTFDPKLFDINIVDGSMDDYDITYAYSYDNINFSKYVIADDFSLDNVPMSAYIAICIDEKITDDLENPTTIYQKVNVDSVQKTLTITYIKYDGTNIVLNDETQIIYKTYHNIINQYPKWNFYDNQKVNIERWKAQCNSMVEMYGHTVIYFKTEPIPEEISHTFRTYVFRNVTSIKKLHIMSPDNELPHDRVIYTEWDMPLADDFIIHVIKDKFESAFGTNNVPAEKDYLYFPLINKMFRVASMQPSVGFMGDFGWWEVSLAKYEDDDTVSIDDELQSAMTSPVDSEMDDAFDELDIVESTVLNEVADYLDDTLNTAEKIDVDTIEEKKTPTQNFSNKLVDSTNYISLKETEAVREFYDKRLDIVSVTPDSLAYPISMYNNQVVDNRTIAMKYKLEDFTLKNKFKHTLIEGFKLSFNYILMDKFNGEVFDLNENEVSYFTISFNRLKQLSIIDNRNGQIFLIDDYIFETREFYNISIEYNENLKQFAFKIFKLVDKAKTLKYENLYITNIEELPTINFDNLLLYGGKFLISEIIFEINNNKIIHDNVNPLLKMKQF